MGIDLRHHRLLRVVVALVSVVDGKVAMGDLLDLLRGLEGESGAGSPVLAGSSCRSEESPLGEWAAGVCCNCSGIGRLGAGNAGHCRGLGWCWRSYSDTAHLGVGSEGRCRGSDLYLCAGVDWDVKGRNIYVGRDRDAEVVVVGTIAGEVAAALVVSRIEFGLPVQDVRRR